MKPPKFLSLEQVIVLQKKQIEIFGGRDGIRDEKLLISALAQPKMGLKEGYLHKNLFEMAAAYLFHLVQNHPFYQIRRKTLVFRPEI